MHYIRLLRSPTLSRSGRRLLLELLFTITTDLGDSFLFPDDFIDLAVDAEISSASGVRGIVLTGKDMLQWRPGMRVAKPTIDVSGAVQSALTMGQEVKVCVRAKPSFSANGVGKIIRTVEGEGEDQEGQEGQEGQVMPVWVTLNNNEADDVQVSTRRLSLNTPAHQDECVEFEEEIGESIARHIWDAGVIAFCAMAKACMLPTASSTPNSCMTALKDVIAGQQTLNVLELGCGVGILGVGLSAVYPRTQPPGGNCTILMTDLEEAEGRARSNMSRLRRPGSLPPAELLYENLDWEDGRKGRFGPEARGRRWDLVMLSDCTYNVDMLPALVETLSALHSSNMAHASPGEQLRTKVFLATKPRHASERALFDLMSREGWAMLHRQILPLPVLGSEAESVELYLYEKL